MQVKVYDYLILLAHTRKELVEKVRAKLEDGWEPQGGVTMDNEGNWAQAVIQRQQ